MLEVNKYFIFPKMYTLNVVSFVTILSYVGGNKQYFLDISDHSSWDRSHDRIIVSMLIVHKK